MKKSNSFKLVELMSCAITLGTPLITSGIVSADTNTSSISQDETKLVFNPNDSLTKQALSKVHQGTIKDVTLVTVQNGNKKDIPMTKQSNGSYIATLSGNQKNIKYQYKIDFQDGASVTINDPHLDNSSNDQYSVVGDKSASSKTNITITTPDGTVIDINGHYDSNKNESSVAKVSVVSSSKLSSSQLNEKKEIVSNSKSNLDSSTKKDETNSSELAKNHENSSKLSSSLLLDSSKEENSQDNEKDVILSSEKKANNQADVIAGNPKETNNSEKKNSQSPDVITSPEANKETNNQENDKQPTENQAAVTNKSNDNKQNSSSLSSSSLNSSSSQSSNESSVAGNDNAQSMPQTGEMILRGLSILGVALLACVGGYYGYQSYKNHKKVK